MSSCGNQRSHHLQGYIEGEFVHVASPLGGHLERLFVYRGDQVEAGDPLFELDASPERAARDEALRRVDEAEAELDDAMLGRRPSEIEAIEAQLKQAQASLDLSRIELARQKKLLQADVTSRREFDTALSTLAKNQLQAIQMSSFIFLPSVMLSGYLFPFRGMPLWAQFLGETLPITHFLRIARGVMLKGMGFDDLGRELWPIALFAIAVLWIGIRRYRRTLD